MRITIKELRQIIKEVVESEMGAPKQPGRFENDVMKGTDGKFYQWYNGKWIKASMEFGDDRSTKHIGWRD